MIELFTKRSIRPFRRIFSVAEIHRFHHLRRIEGDVNFSLFLSFYDHLFGNAYFDRQSLESSNTGVEYVAYPQSWWGQMKAPFQEFESRIVGDLKRIHATVGNRIVRLGGGRQGA